MKKWSVVIQVLLVLAALAGSVYVALTPANSIMYWYSIDDAFYYYKVAQNFLSGQGWTFDGINLANGFHPLWMIVCLGVFWLTKFDLILPLRVLVIVSGLFNAATALILYRTLIRHIHPAAATVAAFFWALSTQIYSTVTVHGMEAAVSAFFLILLVSRASALLVSGEKITFRQMMVIGLIGALTILARLDNVFIVAAVGFFLLFKVRSISLDLLYDLLVIGASVIVSWILRIGLDAIRLNPYSIYPMLGVAILVKPTVFYFCGMYEGFGQQKPGSKFLRQAIAAVVNFILMFTILVVLEQLGILKFLSKSVIVMDAAISTALVFCLRLRRWKPSAELVSPYKRFQGWIKQSWKSILLNGAGYALPIAILIGSYMTINKVIFGAFTPVSGQIKVWWNTLRNTVYAQEVSIFTLLGISPSGEDSPWGLVATKVNRITGSIQTFIGNKSAVLHTVIYLALFIILILLIVAILNSGEKRAGRKTFDLMIPAILFGCLFQIAYYKSVGYQGIRNWYWVSQMMMIVMLGSVLLDPFFVWLDHFPKKPLISTIISLLAVALIFTNHFNYITATFPMKVKPGKETAYLAETKAVESFTEPGSKIGMTGGGIVAYFIEDRTVVNMDGLINSAEYFDALKNGTAGAFLDGLPLDYVYGKAYVLKSSDPYRSFLPERLDKIGMIRGYDNFTLYRYVINQ
jgi:hypothetical protein